MRSSTLSAAALLVGAAQLVRGQTFTDCDPTAKSCPADPALGSTITTDFTQGESSDWYSEAGTKMSYGANGAEFVIAASSDAPTMATNKYIFFGKVEVVAKASAGTGTVSSFILESDDLDEIDWEWLGSTDTSVESNFFGKGNTTTYDRAVYHNVADPIGSFHTYTIDWTAQSLQWSIDGAVVRTLQYSDALALGGKNYPQTPMRIKMGNWIGCADAAATTDPKTQGTCQWAGGAIDLTKGPYTMFVKSVTIQDYGCANEYAYGDMSGSWQSIQSTGGCTGGSSKASDTEADSSSSSSTTSSPKTTTTAAIFQQTGSGNSSTAAATSTTAATTMTTASNPTTQGSSGSSGSSTTTNPTSAAKTSASAASTLKPKHQYGLFDFGIAAFGVLLGYLVM